MGRSTIRQHPAVRAGHRAGVLRRIDDLGDDLLGRFGNSAGLRRPNRRVLDPRLRALISKKSAHLTDCGKVRRRKMWHETHNINTEQAFAKARPKPRRRRPPAGQTSWATTAAGRQPGRLNRAGAAGGAANTRHIAHPPSTPAGGSMTARGKLVSATRTRNKKPKNQPKTKNIEISSTPTASVKTRRPGEPKPGYLGAGRPISIGGVSPPPATQPAIASHKTDPAARRDREQAPATAPARNPPRAGTGQQESPIEDRPGRAA